VAVGGFKMVLRQNTWDVVPAGAATAAGC
jgi:hypothetical protein